MFTSMHSIVTYLLCCSVRNGCAAVAATLIKCVAVLVVAKLHAAAQNEAAQNIWFWSKKLVA